MSESRITVRRVASWVVRVPMWALLGVVKAYQLVISPLTGPTCKYYPSCSNYAVQSLRTHGAIKGFALAVWRVLRCNPWSNGGIDDVPAKGTPLFRRHEAHTHSTSLPTI